jgi:hypothetical protein
MDDTGQDETFYVVGLYCVNPLILRLQHESGQRQHRSIDGASIRCGLGVNPRDQSFRLVQAAFSAVIAIVLALMISGRVFSAPCCTISAKFLHRRAD